MDFNQISLLWTPTLGRITDVILTTPTADYFLTIPVFVETNLRNRETLPGLAAQGKYRIAIVVAKKAMAHDCDQDLETTPLTCVVVFGSIGVITDFLSRHSIRYLRRRRGGGKGGGAVPSFGALLVEILLFEYIIILLFC